MRQVTAFYLVSDSLQYDLMKASSKNKFVFELEFFVA